MNLIPWRKKDDGAMESKGLSSVLQLRSEIDRMFERFFADPWAMTREFGTGAKGWFPSIDVSEGEKEFIVKVDIPGVDPKSIDVAIADRILTIQGEKREEREIEESNVYHVERSFGSFKRSVELPSNIDEQNILAEHRNGVLTIKLGKTKGNDPKKIKVVTAGN